MRISECDDANIISGDGCSSECKAEENFLCNGGTFESPDTCRETVPPMLASFFLFENKKIEIYFTEIVVFKGMSEILHYIYLLVENPMTALQIFIAGPALRYAFEIGNLTLTEGANSLLTLKLNISFLCTLYGTEVLSIYIIYIENDTFNQ